MKEFRPTIEWLKSVLPPEYAKDIKDWWCWEELGAHYRSNNIPDSVMEPIVQAIKDHAREDEEAGACCLYCEFIENREDLVRAIKDSGDVWSCYDYCRKEGNREDLIRVLT